MKLALGCAQFGLDYGISNTSGQTPKNEVKKILDFANANNVNMLDTAPAYGASEKILGDYFSKNNSNFRVSTKTMNILNSKIERLDVNTVLERFEESLKLLNTKKIWSLMIHNYEDLLKPGGQKLYKALEILKESNKLCKLGVSVYKVSDIEKLLNLGFNLDIIQIPLNIYDQRFIKSDLLEPLKKKKVEIHVRSIFLQGLLTLPATKLRPYFNDIREQHTRLHKFLGKNGLTPLAGCLSFVRYLDSIDRIIVGVNNLKQLSEIVSLYNRGCKKIDFESFGLDDEKFLEPRMWAL